MVVVPMLASAGIQVSSHRRLFTMVTLYRLWRIWLYWKNVGSHIGHYTLCDCRPRKWLHHNCLGNSKPRTILGKYLLCALRSRLINRQQAVRGSSPSFGIVTSIQTQTFPSFNETSIYLYSWDLTIAEATTALASWQSFTGSSQIPIDLGGEVVLLKGSAPGRVGVWWFGGYYGPFASFNSTVNPFLETFPRPPDSTNVTQGDWLTGLEAVSFGVGALNTTTAPDTSSGFYAKSLMTPEGELMSGEAMRDLMDYLGNVAYLSDYVCLLLPCILFTDLVLVGMGYRSRALWRSQFSDQRCSVGCDCVCTSECKV